MTTASTLRTALKVLCLVILLTMIAVACFNFDGEFGLGVLQGKPSIPSHHQGERGKPRLANEQPQRHENTTLDSSETANLGVQQEKKQLIPKSFEGEGWKMKSDPQPDGANWTKSGNSLSQQRLMLILDHPLSRENNPDVSENNPGPSRWEDHLNKLILNDKGENLLGNPGLAQGKPPISTFQQGISSQKSWDSPQNPWVAPLKELVRRVNVNNQVALLFSTYSYLNSTLNWLIAAQVRCNPPVTNVIVVCYDMKTHNFLNKEKIPSIFVNPNTLLPGRNAKFTSSTRLIVMMTVTSWGYDAVQYDADAIILKNPRELFERHPHSDIIASRANAWPPTVAKEWGFVACMGVVLFRSTSKIEFLWSAVRNTIESGKGSDQKLVNEAINELGIRWLQSKDNFKQSVDGVCENGLRVTVLSQKDICRKKCKAYSREGNRDQMPYIVHFLRGRKNGEDKKINAIKKKVWWLADGWDSANSDEKMKGREWLGSLVNSSVLL